MLDMRRLRLLHELNQRGTVSAVADALHQSASSISQGLALLEKEVGVTLLRRSGRRLELTPAGHALASRAATLLDMLAEAHAEVLGMAGVVAGSVRIATFQSAAQAILPAMLTTMAREHPQVHLTMSQREPEAALRELAGRDVDLTIAEAYPGDDWQVPPGLDAEHLGVDHLHLTVPTCDESWSAVQSLEDCRELPWVLEPESTATFAFALRTCHAAGFDPDVRYLVDDLETQLRLVESGHAVTIMPSLMMLGREREVRVVALDGDAERRLLSVTRTSLRDTAPILACREALRSAYAEVSHASI